MGYTTWFTGELIPDKPFSKKFIKFINDFSETRHEPRDIENLKAKDVNWAQNCLEGNMGPYGLYYVGPENACRGIIDFESIIDLNSYTPEELAEIRKNGQLPDIGAIGTLMKKLEWLNGMIQKNFTTTSNGLSF